MASQVRTNFLNSLRADFGPLSKVGSSQSLFELGGLRTRVYIRYSKVHNKNQTFFGLRSEDLRQLEGHNSFIAFLWDEQDTPLFLPFEEFEEVLNDSPVASDGQVKVQVSLRDIGTELYIARVGRFKIEQYFGWERLRSALGSRVMTAYDLKHAQVQTLLGAIGTARNFDIWIPVRDRGYLDWSLCNRFSCSSQLLGMSDTDFITQEIDVLWLERGSGRISTAFEVEHSTTIYSGLLRLNDARISAPWIKSFGIVANEKRRSVFTRHLNRPTFKASGLDSHCSFLDYQDVSDWHERLSEVRHD